MTTVAALNTASQNSEVMIPGRASVSPQKDIRWRVAPLDVVAVLRASVTPSSFARWSQLLTPSGTMCTVPGRGEASRNRTLCESRTEAIAHVTFEHHGGAHSELSDRSELTRQHEGRTGTGVPQSPDRVFRCSQLGSILVARPKHSGRARQRLQDVTLRRGATIRWPRAELA